MNLKNVKIEHHFIEINRIKLHLVSAGKKDGPLMIFLHGFPEFWLSWKNQIEHFSNQGYWVVAPDQRGYNLSDKPTSISSYEIDTLADDVSQIIHWAGRERAVVVGHDWGAAVAWWTALKHPKQVEKLIVSNVPHPSVMMKNLMSNLSQIRKSWYIFFFQIPKIPEWYLSRNHARKLASALQNTSRPGTFSHEDLEDYQQAWQKPGSIQAMVNWYRASLRSKPRKGSSQTVSVPTLIIWGEQDQFLGKEMAQQSLKYCKSGRVEIISEASHWVQHEEPQRVNHLIQTFVELQ